MKILDKKKYLILALVVGVFGLSIGLAAFSSTLNIKSSTTVKPDSSNFRIKISASETDSNVTNIAPDYSWSSSKIKKPQGNNVTISSSNNAFSIGDIEVLFTTPGQNVHYVFYAHNIGNLDGYFSSTLANNISGYDNYIKCTAGEGTTDVLVQETCKCIKLEAAFLPPKYAWHSHEITNVLYKPKHSNELKKQAVMPMWLSLIYDGECSTIADGPFNVEIGDIEYTFSTVNN